MKFNTLKVKDILLNFLIPIVSASLSAVLFVVFIYPALSKIPLLGKETEVKKNLEAQLRDKLTNLNKLLDFKSVVDENAALVSNALVSSADVPQLLTQVDTIAKDSGLLVTRLSYSFGETQAQGKENTAKSYSIVNVTLGVSGNYTQIMLFLTNLENSARLVDVDSIRFAKSSKEDSTNLDATIVLNSPYLSVESNAVTDDPINVNINDEGFIKTINKIKMLRLYKTNP